MTIVYDITRLVDRSAALYPTGVDRVDLRYALWTRRQASDWKAVYQRPNGFEEMTDLATALLKELESRWIVGAKIEPTDFWTSSRRKEAQRENEVFILEKLSKLGIRDRWQERTSWLARLVSCAPRWVAAWRQPRQTTRTFAWPKGGGLSYWNIGHNYKFSSGIKSIPLARVKTYFFIHDLIPLTHPETQKKSSAFHFASFCQHVAECGDVIISSAQYTFANNIYFADKRKVIVPLATEDRFHNASAPDAKNHYLVVGTIEPRKNISLLLDAWELLKQRMSVLPVLRIVGKRSWANDDLFERMDVAKHEGWLEECSDVSDEQMLAFLLEAKALLFPSRVEGWGIPVAESLNAGVPVVCSDTPLMREVSQLHAIFCDPLDPQEWAKVIENEEFKDPSLYQGITWSSYFERLEEQLEN